ncbi:MAG: Fe-S oxidoreductase [Micrococcales bacterium]|nr:Fe-S oxidoreductase [Micrococcales bacterium]
MTPIPTPPPGWESAADRAVARGRMLDRWLPLLDSPVSRAGSVVGTAIGFVWGFLWSTGRVRRHRGADGTVLYVFSGMPSWTFPRGGACVGACYLTADNVGPRVLRHELVHARQWRRYGMLMPLLYQLSGRNPLRNRFEIEAGLADGNYIPRQRPRRTVSR